MTKLFAMFASVILVANFSACQINHEKESSALTSVSFPQAKSSEATLSVASKNSEVPSADTSPAPSLPPSPEYSAQSTQNIINNKNITIIPQQDNRIIITYPKHEMNQGDIQPTDQNYTLTLTPGDYTDPQNAVTTFLYDLYMKQSLCYENIHRDITEDPDTFVFVKTLFSMEDLVLNLGQIDVLVLPKVKYDSDGVPFVYQNAAAYKTTEDGVIRFGNTCESADFRQVTKGNFSIEQSRLYFLADTAISGRDEAKTYFEAIKKSNGDFIYRSLNSYKGYLQSVFVTVSEDLMQAGFSQGVLPQDYIFTPLAQTPTLEASDTKNGLRPLYYLFASEDGAMITEPDEKKEIK